MTEKYQHKKVSLNFKASLSMNSEYKRFKGMFLFIQKFFEYKLVEVIYENCNHYECYVNFDIPEIEVNTFEAQVRSLLDVFFVTDYVIIEFDKELK